MFILLARKVPTLVATFPHKTSITTGSVGEDRQISGPGAVLSLSSPSQNISMKACFILVGEVKGRVTQNTGIRLSLGICLPVVRDSTMQ